MSKLNSIPTIVGFMGRGKPGDGFCAFTWPGHAGKTTQRRSVRRIASLAVRILKEAERRSADGRTSLLQPRTVAGNG